MPAALRNKPIQQIASTFVTFWGEVLRDCVLTERVRSGVCVWAMYSVLSLPCHTGEVLIRVPPPPASLVGSGAHLWDASVVLSRFLCSAPLLVADRVVVELGAGAVGLPGLVCASLGARRVVLTDQEACVPHLHAAARLQEHSAVATRVVCCALPWGSNLRRALRPIGGIYGSDSAPPTPLLLLVSDALSLSPVLFEPLAKTLDDLATAAGPAGARALIAYRERDGTEHDFFSLLAGWEVHLVAEYHAVVDGGAPSSPALAFRNTESGLSTSVCIVEATKRAIAAPLL